MAHASLMLAAAECIFFTERQEALSQGQDKCNYDFWAWAMVLQLKLQRERLVSILTKTNVSEVCLHYTWAVYDTLNVTSRDFRLNSSLCGS